MTILAGCCWVPEGVLLAKFIYHHLSRSLLTNSHPGAGESGKSTILKQMKIINEGGYSRDERESFKEIIFSNTVQSMRVILEAMESLELPLEDQRAEYHVQTIFMQPSQIEGERLPPEVGQAIAVLWKDSGVQECFKRSREYQLNDSAR
jgi:guanine nucleotide-binding protein subunit alpha